MENSLIPTESTDLADTPQSGMAFVMPGDFPDLETAEVGMSIEKKYFKFTEKGKKIRAVFNGMDFITSTKNNQRTQIPAIVFQTLDGVFLNSGSSLVEQFKTIPPGTPVQIEYLGDAKTNSGNNVKKFDVRLLKIGVKTVRVVENGKPVTQKADEFKNTDLSTDYWTKAKELRFSQQEGLDHLAACGNDFKMALSALGTDDMPF